MSIYPVREDTLLVKRNLESRNLNGKEFLEIGVGNAELSKTAAEKGAEVTGVDINPEAVNHARERFSIENLDGRFRESDLFEEVESIYDFIVFNPPYLKGKEGIGGEGMWRGGETGLETPRRFLEKVSDYLSEDGEAWIILSSLTDYEKSVEEFNLELVDEQKLWFETILLYKLE